MQGEEEYQHFIQWTPRTRIRSTAPENQFNAKSFDILKSVIYKAFASLPAAREAFCAALAEFNRLTGISAAIPQQEPAAT
jgi:hypothetical protein